MKQRIRIMMRALLAAATAAYVSCFAIGFAVAGETFVIDAINGPGGATDFRWQLDGGISSKNKLEVFVKPGDILIFRQASPIQDHGVEFLGPELVKVHLCGDPRAATNVLYEMGNCPGGTQHAKEPGIITTPGAKTELMRFMVLESLPTDLPFQCSVHGVMTGVIKLRTTPPLQRGVLAP